jgi:hypothetical protein
LIRKKNACGNTAGKNLEIRERAIKRIRFFKIFSGTFLAANEDMGFSWYS